MSSFRIPMILSVSFHVLIFGIFTFLMKRTTQPPPPDTLSVFISPLEEKHNIAGETRTFYDEKEKDSESSANLRTKHAEKTEPIQQVESGVPKPDDGSNEAWASFLEKGEARVALLRQDVDNDSVIARENAFTEPTMAPLRIEKFGFGGRDPVADGIYKRNVGTQPFLMSLTPLAEIEKRTVRSPSLDFLPTHSQLFCLSRLMDEDSLTDTQLYPLLEGTANTSFENFRKEMDRLAEKGLVVREKISPSQIFSFFGFPVEMSLKNRRNPEFRYKPNIDRKLLLIFLEARLYDVKEQLKENPGDSILIQNQINSLMEKLALIRPVND